MAHWIGLAKAAHLLNISRRDLQKLIQHGDLSTFEGCVDFEELRRRYPALALEESSFMENLAFLQETAFSRRVRDTVMPVEDLAASLKKRTAELAVERARAQKYGTLLRELASRVATMQCDAEGETKRALHEINLWLLERLEGIK